MFGLLFLLFGAAFVIVLYRALPKPDIDRPHLVSTPRERGGLTLRTLLYGAVGLAVLGLIVGSYAAPAGGADDDQDRMGLLGSFLVWAGTVVIFRTLPLADRPYELQWGRRIRRIYPLRAIEHWAIRLEFLVMAFYSLRVAL